MMNNTLVIALVALGAFLWIVGMLREHFKSGAGTPTGIIVRKLFAIAGTGEDPPGESAVAKNVTETVSLESLERELGIDPEHYLCDRVARINAALAARREKAPAKKKGGTA